MKRSTKIVIASIITLIIAVIAFYFMLPALNVFNQELWMFMILGILVWGGVYVILGLKDVKDGKVFTNKGKSFKDTIKNVKIFAIIKMILDLSHKP